MAHHPHIRDHLINPVGAQYQHTKHQLHEQQRDIQYGKLEQYKEFVVHNFWLTN
jgi:hypothetical protein